MVGTCNIKGCKTNYKSQKEKHPVFKLPDDETLRKAWLQKIPTDLSKIKTPHVCAKHFHPSSIIKFDKFNVDGEVLVVPRKRIKLADGAIPTIFDGITDTTPAEIVEQSSTMDSVSSEQTLVENLKKLKLSDITNHFLQKNMENWVHIGDLNKLILCYIDTDKAIPHMIGSVVVNTDLSAVLRIDKIVQEIPKKIRVVDTLKIFDELMTYADEKMTADDATCSLPGLNVQLEKYASINPSKKLSFIIEQLNYNEVKNRRYKYYENTIIFATCIYLHSPTAYNYLRDNKFVVLPHPSGLRKLFDRLQFDKCSIEEKIEKLKIYISSDQEIVLE